MAIIIGVSYGIMALLPIFVGDIRFIMNIMIMCLIWAVVASCWDVMMGFAGIFSFGQVAFFVMGAYCSGILAIEHNVTPVLSIPIAGLFTAGMGVLVGLPCLRLAGPYIALVTFGVHMALQPTLRGGGGGNRPCPGIRRLGRTFDNSTHQHIGIYLQLGQYRSHLLFNAFGIPGLRTDDYVGD